MTQRAEKVASILWREIQNVLTRGLADPRVMGMTSVTEVSVSDDLAHATVMVSVMPEECASLTLHGLQHATQHIRTRVGKQVRLRRMPRLIFRLDKSLKKEASILAAIANARRRDAEFRSGCIEQSLPEDPES
jgi:ribosome-binding factor A